MRADSAGVPADARREIGFADLAAHRSGVQRAPVHSLRKTLALCIFSILAVVASADEPTAGKGPLRFTVKLDAALSKDAVSGRLVVFMTSQVIVSGNIGTGFIPGSTYICAKEVTNLTPTEPASIDPDALAYPKPFSQAGEAEYSVMALLDQNHNYNYLGEDSGDLKSTVVFLGKLNPASAGSVELTLSRNIPALSRAKESETLKSVEFESPSLSAFWGRPITMRAAVAFPPNFGKNGPVPTAYEIPGFSAGFRIVTALAQGAGFSMATGKMPPMVRVFLDPSCPGGHHVFADSVNNGPWGRALTTELIPHLEKTFGLVAEPVARFLTGHSSGGWSSLWLQITYPEFFGGTWSTAPDPVDLRNYTGIDATPGSKDNAYREADGSPKQLVRSGAKWLASFEQFARQEAVLGEYGGQFASFEWVWSPRGADGRPLPLFDRQTGKLNQATLEGWQRYDIHKVLEKNWDTLSPKLAGKLHLFCGSVDQFRLNESFVLLRDFLREKGSDAVCELIEGRSHGDLHRPHEKYPAGLNARIFSEMLAAFEKSQAAKAPAGDRAQ